MPETADAIVVGGGANGLSTAYHLARAGVKRVLLIEKNHLGAGATGKSGALVRTHYTNEPETRLAYESLKVFANWYDVIGGDCGFQPIGLVVFVPERYGDHLAANVEMQRRVGANARLDSPGEVADIHPALSCEDTTKIAYEPDSGYADPSDTAYSLARAGKGLGVQFMLDTTVTRLITGGGRVRGVRTTRGDIEAPIVVVAAGAWANALFEPLGLNFGLRPYHARVSLFRWSMDRAATPITCIDHINGTWTRPDGNRTLIGAEAGVDRDVNPDCFPEVVMQEYVTHCRQKLVNRFPVMRHSTMRGNWAGVFMQSPDGRPLIGPLPGVDGAYCMTGDSGTSFKTSPAIGRCLAELITEGMAHTVDLTPFRPSRILDGEFWRDEHDYGLTDPTISR